MRISSERGHFFQDHREREVGRGVKEKLCYIAFDYDTELKSTAESSDKKQTRSQTETFLLSEPHVSVARLFFPANFIGIQASGVHDTSFHNIMKCDVDIRVNSYVPVMLAGGTTMFQEIGERRTKKPTEVPPPTTKIKMGAPPERQYSVRIGGSILFFFF